MIQYPSTVVEVISLGFISRSLGQVFKNVMFKKLVESYKAPCRAVLFGHVTSSGAPLPKLFRCLWGQN